MLNHAPPFPQIKISHHAIGSLIALIFFCGIFEIFGEGNRYLVILCALISGPAWADFYVVLFSVRHRLFSEFEFSSSHLFLGLFVALWMPLGVVEGFPVPIWAFCLIQFFSQSIGWPLLLLFYAVWFFLWMILYIPTHAMLVEGGRDVGLGVLILATSLAFGLFPVMSLIFQGTI